MKVIEQTSQFKKDLKRIKNNPKRIAELGIALRHLKYNGNVPDSYNPHRLKGDYKDLMECHIGGEGDFLLLWFEKDEDVIKLVRVGSHNEIFGKGKKR